MASNDREFLQGNIETTGRLITGVDATQLGKGDFQELSNMRYTARGIRSIQGMSKINVTPLSSPHVRNIKQFKNDYGESNVIVQAFNSDNSSSSLFYSADPVAEASTFSNLFTETQSAPLSIGNFTNAPDGVVAYGNGKELVVWGGTEARCAGFQVADADGVASQPTKLFDYLGEISDQTLSSVATISQRYVHIASTRRLNGVKFYVSTANTSACSVAVKYWNGTSWNSVSNLNDGTSIGGKTLAQTGTVTFDSTVTAAKPRYFNGTVLYWYLFDFNGLNTATTITQCTVSAPPQALTNIWDGKTLDITSFQVYNGTNYEEHSAQVFALDYVSGATTTYYSLTSFPTTKQMVVGFADRMMGIRFHLAPSSDGTSATTNTAASTMTVKYWNGQAWVTIFSVDDTAVGGATLNRSGEVTWYPPDSSLEFKNSITSKDQFYYYQISFSAQLSANSIFLDFIEGIPFPSNLDTYLFPVSFQNRLALCNNQSGDKNSILLSSLDTNNVFNGKDSTTLYFGDSGPIVAATTFYSRFSNDFFETLLVCKTDSVWVVDGTSIADPNAGGYVARRISTSYGCAAPGSMASCDVGISSGVSLSSGTSRHSVIWQAGSAIVLWDGSTIFPISTDIEDVFDSIEPTMINRSMGFFDEDNSEYHWLFASTGNTTLNKEYVFDLINKKWFTIDRGTGNYIQCGCKLTDSIGNSYTYGGTNYGYVELLENGTTFDGTSITSIWHTGDIPLGGWMRQTQLRRVKPIFVAKNNTTNQMLIEHFGDTQTVVANSLQFAVGSSVGRLGVPSPRIQSVDGGPFIFHSFKNTMITDNEEYGFEPIGLSINYKNIREDV